MGQMQTIHTQRPKKAASRHADTMTQLPGRAFTILCPRAQQEGVVAALQAMLYLPKSYELIVASSGADKSMTYQNVTTTVSRATKTADVTRTRLATSQAELPATVSPFSFVDVVVYRGSGPTLTDGPSQSLIVFNISTGRTDAHGGHNFRVCANTPEALASAILSVTRG